MTITTAASWATAPITSPSVQTEFTNIAASGSGQIVTTAASPNGTGEFDVNGFQLVPLHDHSLWACNVPQHEHRGHGQFHSRFRWLGSCQHSRRV